MMPLPGLCGVSRGWELETGELVFRCYPLEIMVYLQYLVGHLSPPQWKEKFFLAWLCTSICIKAYDSAFILFIDILLKPNIAGNGPLIHTSHGILPKLFSVGVLY
jgi:hypothetical protein